MTTRRRLGLVLAAAMAVIIQSPSVVQAATWYYYHPGHPMMIQAGSESCTGGWAIRGSDGMFFVSAGHCRLTASGFVYGTDAAYGYRFRNDNGRLGGMDAMLVRPLAGVDAKQTVVGGSQWPGGVIGNTVGQLNNSALTMNRSIGKYGRISGWSTGTIVGTGTWGNAETVYLTNYDSTTGDSGGPVLINDGHGRVWAAGMHIGKTTVNTPTGPIIRSAFISIEDLLANFGAWLPVFPSNAPMPPPDLGDTGEKPPVLPQTGEFILE